MNTEFIVIGCSILSWVVIGAIHSFHHIYSYPDCCQNHPDLVNYIHKNGRVPLFTHYCHVFCRYFWNSLAIIVVVPLSAIMFSIWLVGRVYYTFLQLNKKNESIQSTASLKQDKLDEKKKKVVAVIGAGPSGIITAKYLLEAGHKVIVFEKSDKIGGSFQWSYSGLLTSSNFITQFSDLHIDAVDLDDLDEEIRYNRIKMGTFLKFGEYCSYLTRYAKTFNIYECIKFNTSVEDMEYDSINKEWRLQTSLLKEYKFDHIAICTGIACKPKIPNNLMNHMNNGKIEIIHSNSFGGENDQRLQNKNVLIIGCGESGSDVSFIASKICQKYAKECYLTTRNGPGYLIPRFFGGMPADMDTSRLYHTSREYANCCATRFKRWIESFWITPYDDLGVLGKAEEINTASGLSTPFEKFGTKSLHFIRGILYNDLKHKPDIKCINFDTKEITFIDDSRMKQCDLIICCTGYKQSESNFFKKPIIVNQLFEKMFDINYGDALCFIGLNRPFIGSLPPLSEMSARYYSLIISNQCKLPSKFEMMQSIKKENELQKHQFANNISESIPTLCDFLTKYDSLSKLVGCDTSNNMFQLFINHPLIWYHT